MNSRQQGTEAAISSAVSGDATLPARRITLPNLATIAAVVATIYFAKDVVLPLAIAMLVTFALSPLVTRLRKIGLPHLPSVLLVVTTTCVAISLFLLVVVAQIGTLAQNLPTFQANIIAKVETLREAGKENGIISRFSDMVTAINAEIGEVVPTSPQAPQTGDAAPEATVENPMPVEVVESSGPFALLRDLVLPLISPIAMVGLVVVVVIFMLLEREELRDRFIKLVGSSDLHRTTGVMQDAGERVTQYLLVQLLVNVIYAVPIGVGLWFIGVPNAVLWGLVTLVLRFVPYIGTLLSAAFPLFLAFAIVPDWSAVLWTIALFGTVELITSNAIEPKLYGSRTGVSPLAIIISAIFWAWLWGPLGLVMSTPLTVCLVVLGRHIPQFAVFDILFGDEPTLAPHARLYQRLLVGDVVEATARAEEALETVYLADYYRDIGVPALLNAQNDRGRGVLVDTQMQTLAEAAHLMIADLAEVVAEELEEAKSPPTEGQEPAIVPDDGAMTGEGFRVVCVGGRSEIDDVSAAMLAQAMQAKGAVAAHRPHSDLAASRFRALATDDHDCVVFCFLDPSPSRGSLLQVRRIKLAAPHLRVGVVIWDMPVETGADGKFGAAGVTGVSATSLKDALDIGADFAVKGFDAVLTAAFTNEAPIKVAARRKKPRPGEARRPGLAASGAAI